MNINSSRSHQPLTRQYMILLDKLQVRCPSRGHSTSDSATANRTERHARNANGCLSLSGCTGLGTGTSYAGDSDKPPQLLAFVFATCWCSLVVRLSAIASRCLCLRIPLPVLCPCLMPLQHWSVRPHREPSWHLIDITLADFNAHLSTTPDEHGQMSTDDRKRTLATYSPLIITFATYSKEYRTQQTTNSAAQHPYTLVDIRCRFPF